MRPGILTLTTDFGTEGPYVAAVKGVILTRAPGTQMVDITHRISPQNVLEGAFVLAEVFDTFPPGTVHLAVVDPGVGTDRRLIAASVADRWFVLPDNGLLSAVTRGRPPAGVWEITNPALWRTPISATFHGRDILAPAAAHLVVGGDPGDLGPIRSDHVVLENFEVTRADGGALVGEVIFRDAFGNLITNIESGLLGDAPLDAWDVEIAGSSIRGLSRTYADRPAGTLVALIGSTGWVEVAVVNGDAARHVNAGPGTTVWIRRKGGSSEDTPVA